MPKGTALITGASEGIGTELARLCAADGYDLVLVARRANLLTELATELSRAHGVQVRALPVDLADAASPRAIFEATGADQVELLINNAGFGLRGPFAETDWEADSRLLQVNVLALMHLTKLYLPAMLRRRSGRILNVASTAAFVPGPFMAMYYSSKACIFSFSLAIAEEVQGSGVTVTALCPGPTRTGFFKAAGIAGVKLVEGPSMSARDVAIEGYRAMMAGKREVIAGARNRWMILGTRLAPRTMLAGIARRLNTSAS